MVFKFYVFAKNSVNFIFRYFCYNKLKISSNGKPQIAGNLISLYGGLLVAIFPRKPLIIVRACAIIVINYPKKMFN